LNTADFFWFLKVRFKKELLMYLCLMTDSLGQLPFEKMLDQAAELGIRALEFACGAWSRAPHIDLDGLLAGEDKRRRFLDAIAARNMTIEAFNCSGNQLAPNEEGEAHQLVVEKTFRLAELCGVSKIVMMSGLPGGAPEDTTPNWIVSSWPPITTSILEWQWNEAALPYWERTAVLAGKHGVTRIALENHGCQLVYNPASLKRLRDHIGPLVGMNLDPSHLFWMGGDPIAALEELGSAIYHVHAKDVRIEEGRNRINGLLDTQTIDKFSTRTWNYVAVGYGHDAVWWKTFCSRLRMAAYDGAVSLEIEDQLMDQVTGTKKSAAFLNECIIAGESPL
jgi:sugar phosphate isomerase/epimerase